MELNREHIDYYSKLLFGKPITFDGIDVYPLKIREVMEYSLDTYNKFLSLISLNRTEIMESLNIVQEVPLYQFIILNIVNDTSNEFIDWFLKTLSMILKDDVLFTTDGYFLIGESNKKIDENNFEQIVQIIKDQNFMKEKKETITTKKERDYKEMVKKARERHKGYLKALGKLSDTDLLDLMSSLSAKHPSINLLQIQDLTIYQLIDQYKRLNMIDDYFIAIDSLFAGADKKSVDLIHWSKKFQD